VTFPLQIDLPDGAVAVAVEVTDVADLPSAVGTWGCSRRGQQLFLWAAPADWTRPTSTGYARCSGRASCQCWRDTEGRWSTAGRCPE
jgi:hypothetical protein